jgi:AhpD family alkylhydroperoxidase
MSVIRPLEPDAAPGKSKNLLDAVNASLGMVPNLFRVMAHSPATLEGFLSFNSALGAGTLDAKLRERIALAVAEENSCGYCLSAHSLLGKGAGLDDSEIAESGSEPRARRPHRHQASSRRGVQRRSGRGNHRQRRGQHLHQLREPRRRNLDRFPGG